MARLINDKGTWLLQIEKSDHKGILTLLSDLPGTYLCLESQDAQTLTFGFAEWDHDGMENTTEMYGSKHLRNILSKISENPDPDLIIPREPQEPPLSDEEYKKLVLDFQMEGLSGHEIIMNPKVYRYLLGQYPKQVDYKFMEQMGLNPNTGNTTLKWTEDNKLEK